MAVHSLSRPGVLSDPFLWTPSSGFLPWVPRFRRTVRRLPKGFLPPEGVPPTRRVTHTSHPTRPTSPRVEDTPSQRFSPTDQTPSPTETSGPSAVGPRRSSLRVPRHHRPLVNPEDSSLRATGHTSSPSVPEQTATVGPLVRPICATPRPFDEETLPLPVASRHTKRLKTSQVRGCNRLRSFSHNRCRTSQGLILPSGRDPRWSRRVWTSSSAPARLNPESPFPHQ